MKCPNISTPGSGGGTATQYTIYTTKVTGADLAGMAGGRGDLAYSLPQGFDPKKNPCLVLF